MPKSVAEPTALYRFYDAANRLLYVGISVDFPKRLGQHERDKEWFPRVHVVAVEHYPNRASALAAEAHYIRTRSPMFNIAGRAPGDPPRDDPKPEREASGPTRILATDAITEALRPSPGAPPQAQRDFSRNIVQVRQIAGRPVAG